MKIAIYILGTVFIALVYQFISGEESFFKAVVIAFTFSWLNYLLLHFLGMIKYERSNRLH